MFRSSTSLTESEAQVGFLFHVMIGINPLGEFRSVKGIGRNIAHQEFREGGRNHSPHLRVGPAKYKECTIEWGMSNRTTLYDWIHAVEAGFGYKRQVWVLQLSRSRQPMRIYQLMDAFPISWEGAELDANNNTVDTEQITIVYEAALLLTMPEEISNLPSFSIETVAVGEGTSMEALETDELQVSGITHDGEGTGPVLEFGGVDELAEEEEGAPPVPEDDAAWLEEQARLTRERRAAGAEGLKFTPDEEEESEEPKENADPAAPAPRPGPLKLSGAAAAAAAATDGGETSASEEDTTDASTAGGGRPEPVKLRMSGGAFFAATTFEPSSAEEGEDEG